MEKDIWPQIRDFYPDLSLTSSQIHNFYPDFKMTSEGTFGGPVQIHSPTAMSVLSGLAQLLIFDSSEKEK